MERAASLRLRAEKEISEKGFHLLKNLILTVLSVLALIVFLCFPVISKTNDALALSAGISGFRAIVLLFTGGEMIYYDEYIGNIGINVPTAPTIMIVAGVVLMLAVAGTSLYGAVFRRDLRKAGFLAAGTAAYLAVFYIVLISGIGIMTEDFSMPEPQIVKFYEVYSVESTVLIAAVLFGLQAICCFGITHKNIQAVKRYYAFYLMAIIPLIFIFIFCLYPILLQIISAFKDYTLAGGVSNSKWIGLQNFITIFTSSDMLYTIWNTIYISLIKIIISIVLPLFLAIILFDMPFNKYRKAIQTLVYIPHFFSWTVIYAISYAFLNPSGIINKIIEIGFHGDVVLFLERREYFVLIQAVTFAWKETGWNTIIYFAALMGIDMSLYEAAKIDGAGPMRRLASITIPSIMPVIVFMCILSLGNVLKSAGGEQMLLYYNYAVMKEATVIDTWLYYRGMIDMEYGIGSAMLFFQSAVGILLVLGCNWLSKRVTDRTIW